MVQFPTNLVDAKYLNDTKKIKLTTTEMSLTPKLGGKIITSSVRNIVNPSLHGMNS